jgi:hypothetical protein
MVKAWSIIATAAFSLVTLSAADAATSAPSAVPASSTTFTMCKSTHALHDRRVRADRGTKG